MWIDKKKKKIQENISTQKVKQKKTKLGKKYVHDFPCVFQS